MWLSYKQVRGEVFPTHARKLYRGNGCIAPFVLNRAAMGGVSDQIKAPVVLSRLKCLCFSLAKGICGLQSQIGNFGYKKNSFANVGIRTTDRPGRSLVTVLYAMCWLPIKTGKRFNARYKHHSWVNPLDALVNGCRKRFQLCPLTIFKPVVQLSFKTQHFLHALYL